ncbi:DUF2490 domain-containing protein [Zunongwangia sp. H14]|uniref:DUF2490 domain-containing protein n=1 Tax=Zunongwangia sp. H14 TaxID=3240792 RepID=UPI0035641DFC
MKKKIFTSLALLGSLIISAQNPEGFLGSWTLIAGRHKIAEKWSIPTIAILQYYRVYEDFQFVLARTGISYDLSPQVQATVGYDYFHSEAFEGSAASGKDQNRLFEELVLKNKYKNLGVSHRYRLESIWTSQNDENSLAHRVRYRLNLQYPLYKNLYATAFDEIFTILEKPYFNQNRLHLGFGYVFNPHYKMEIGYFRSNFSTTSYNRVRVAIIFNTDLSKKTR